MLGFNDLGNEGHLGNQMFQYASLMGIAHNRNFDWAIAPRESFGTRYKELRSSIYNCFKLPSAKNQKIIEGPVLREPTPYFNKDLFDNCPDNITVAGYLQDEQYFKNIKEDILKEFTFIDHIKDEAEKFLREYKEAQKVSIHIRRTDYVDGPASGTRSCPTLDYYKQAMSLFENSIFFIFSDDLEWCKSQSIFTGDNVIFPGRDAYIDICIMSLCDHNIIANSSYSWWASYLNKNPNKKVVAPPARKWLDYRDASHMYLADWIVLEQE